MRCPNLFGCPLFPLFRMKSSLRVWQTRYCEGDHTSCERFRLAKAGTRVPPNLLPNGKALDLAAAPEAGGAS
jgi:hypothetical protein